MHSFRARGAFVPTGLLISDSRFGRLFPNAALARQPATHALIASVQLATSSTQPVVEPRDSATPAGFSFLAQPNDLDFNPEASIAWRADPTSRRQLFDRANT